MIPSAEIELFGYVGKDPVTPFASNPNFVTFSLSINDKRIDKTTNEEIKTTTWFECQTSNENMAAIIKARVKKGMQLYVKGYPRCDAYLDKDGKATASFKVNIIKVNDFISIDTKEESKSIPAKHYNDLNDDEIPF